MAIEIDTWIREQHENGTSISQIARDTKMSRAAVYRRLGYYGGLRNRKAQDNKTLRKERDNRAYWVRQHKFETVDGEAIKNPNYQKPFDYAGAEYEQDLVAWNYYRDQKTYWDEFQHAVLGKAKIKMYHGPAHSDWAWLPVWMRGKNGLFPDEIAEELKQNYPQYGVTDENSLRDKILDLLEFRRQPAVVKPEKPGITRDDNLNDEYLYCLLACSNGNTLEDPDGLKWWDIFDWLLDQGPVLWSYSFGYDVNQILPPGEDGEYLRLLAKNNRCYIGKYSVEFIPRKVFRITERRKEDGKWKRVRSVVVWDLYTYQNTSFAKYIDEWHLADESEQEFVKKMKADRSDFQEQDYETIKKYCLLECKLLRLGVEKFLDAAERVGYRPQAWYSPGSIAAAAMREHHIKDYFGDIPDVVSDLSKAAYFGGRFENGLMGYIPGPVYDYDIRSAYPYAMTKLPCLACGTWTYHEHYKPQEGDWALCKVRWGKPRRWAKHPEEIPTWGPFPVRWNEHDILRYPATGEGWYWAHETLAANLLTPIEWGEAWVYETDCNHKPFAYLGDIYEQRKELKRSGDAAQYVLKLIINSSYGKLAQRVGSRHTTPALQNFVWAGMITSYCRMQILQALSQDPEAVIQIATDGIISRRRLNLPVGPALGEWEEQEYGWVFQVGTGIYWLGKVGEAIPSKTKTRGYSKVVMSQEYQQVYDAFMANKPYISIRYRQFVGYKTALKSKRGLSIWRSWVENERMIRFDPAPRREIVRKEQDYFVTKPILTKGSYLDSFLQVLRELAPADVEYESQPEWWDEPLSERE